MDGENGRNVEKNEGRKSKMRGWKKVKRNEYKKEKKRIKKE